jgi:hypothetical protein
MIDDCRQRQGLYREIRDENLLFAEDFTSNALLQVRVYWTGTAAGKVHEKPFLILVSAAPQAPAGKDGGKTYLLERPYGISMKFGVDELAALGFALDRIASGAAERNGTDNTWVKWADPTKAKGGTGEGIGKKMLSVTPVQKNTDKTKRTVNLSFFCMLAASTSDPRGILKNCKRDGQGIKYGVTVNLGAYQAMSVAMNLLSLVDKLTEIDRSHRIRRFRETYAQTRGSGSKTKIDDSPGKESGGSSRVNMRLHHGPASQADAPSSGRNAGAGAAGSGNRTTGGNESGEVGVRRMPASSDVQSPKSGTPGGPRPAQPAADVRKPSVYGSRDSDFSPRPARRLAT